MTVHDTAQGLLSLTADIVASHVANNTVAVSDLPSLIQNVHGALAKLGGPVEPETPPQEPAVSIRASVKPDFIVCLESGKKLKMLKRHLMTHFNLTPEQYRAKWNLPADYPMVAPNYALKRQELAKKIVTCPIRRVHRIRESSGGRGRPGGQTGAKRRADQQGEARWLAGPEADSRSSCAA